MNRELVQSFVRMFLTADTRLMRFWFALCSIGYANWVFFDDHYSVLHPSINNFVDVQMLPWLFLTHACVSIYSVLSEKTNTYFLFLEGVLGVFLWLVTGISETTDQGSLGPNLIASFMAIYLLVRYPTHYRHDSRRSTD
jgi:hypothetical protein